MSLTRQGMCRVIIAMPTVSVFTVRAIECGRRVCLTLFLTVALLYTVYVCVVCKTSVDDFGERTRAASAVHQRQQKE